MAVTRLGSAGLLLPVLTVSALGLWRSSQSAALRVWLSSLVLAVMLTLASKVLFFGWGVGSAAFDFTGISGHAVLAMSVLPVFGSSILALPERPVSVPGVVLGVVLAIVVGVSRVVLDAHSWSEVIAAWSIGGCVSVLALKAVRRGAHCPRLARWAPLMLLLALGAGVSSYLPTHDWEVELSLCLSGRAHPFTRHHLQSGAVRDAARRGAQPGGGAASSPGVGGSKSSVLIPASPLYSA